MDSLLKTETPAFFDGHSGLVLSCSGGTDSTALFHLLYKQIKFNEAFPLVLLHFNFGLRGKESDEDQLFVENLAKEYGVRILVRKVSASELETRSEKNVQAWARSIRMHSFKDLIKDGWLIALAHQKDDLAENILLRMTRGVSPGSLLGMSEWNPPYWRPLLNLGREEILAWLCRHKLPYRHDSSNDKMEYSRNVIRHRVLPELKKLNPKARDHIVRCARETQEFVEFTRRSLHKEQSTSASMLADKNLAELPKGIAYDVLSCGIGRPETRGINHRILQQALGVIHSPQTKKTRNLAQLPMGRSLVQENGAIKVVQSSSVREKPRYKQHAAAIFSEEKAIILGPSAKVDFFPIPAGTVLDQKFQVCNSELVVKKFNEF